MVLTPNEVAFARRNASRMVLYVCAGVEVRKTDSAVETAGGTPRMWRPWSVDEGALRPVAFTYVTPRGAE